MPKLFLGVACVRALTIVGPALSASEASKATGTVQQVGKQTGRIVIDGQSFDLQQSGPLALTPQVGQKVTVLYEERSGQKVITRIGQG
jgi:hypothetical protein